MASSSNPASLTNSPIFSNCHATIEKKEKSYLRPLFAVIVFLKVKVWCAWRSATPLVVVWLKGSRCAVICQPHTRYCVACSTFPVQNQIGPLFNVFWAHFLPFFILFFSGSTHLDSWPRLSLHGIGFLPLYSLMFVALSLEWLLLFLLLTFHLLLPLPKQNSTGRTTYLGLLLWSYGSMSFFINFFTWFNIRLAYYT